MTQDQDPEQRAFTGGAEAPPKQPDQPPERNGEYLRKGKDGRKRGAASSEDDSAEDPHGEYTNLPGYGG